METPQKITDLLQAWEQGDQSAFEKLVPLVEVELWRIAKGYMRHERPGHTLQTTALVNEACIKLIGQESVLWQSRSHFYAIAAQCMRRVLIDYAKNRQRAKRGGDLQQVELSEAMTLSQAQSKELLELDEALRQLALVDERKVKVVELRYFCGYSLKEAAALLNVSEVTVARDWRLARSWLRREIFSARS